MHESERREEGAGGPATERGVGDEVAEEERSGRAASGGSDERGQEWRWFPWLAAVAGL